MKTCKDTITHCALRNVQSLSGCGWSSLLQNMETCDPNVVGYRPTLDCQKSNVTMCRPNEKNYFIALH